MITEDDIRLIEGVAIKIRRKLDGLEKDKELCEELCNLTKKEKHTIFAISDKGNKTMGEIAENLGVTVSTPTTTINRLIEKGYVCRDIGKEDRRKVLVSLTDEGKKLYKQMLNMRIKNLEIIFETLSDIELDMFRKLMKKLNSTL
ncbi:MarR family winged helix-turn-helix transcriptional regulator [Paramaledivibacter caminithermalis]|uniref:DNA-binding transcriptional regulator, MarR family n=1 Tax=Paramaledivibacter caminithermalis (strain DSM 15212 / CIP 107654 / DViRD3) TaxID=1121301 RepID=A0A1M6MSA4_PARC5|nr:MarR family transcriptional regulator [Paramaledivibacter caminithermalis]SHJ86324.1 DNA-binding transcriptional regulator, MarR family [Paramaledivibacter caminithermalis DSM 15212]